MSFVVTPIHKVLHSQSYHFMQKKKETRHYFSRNFLSFPQKGLGFCLF
ncbi:hypothetical protein HMPREF9512_02068 [Enterococcus faecalis EnGen0311]|nr:hypothetical protein HMPREF9512_02068 [Enterococcus faecalis EnGen0311]